MKYAIIAAGEGSRLTREGVKTPKPLVMINGEQLTDRLIRVFMDNGAEEIIIICNDHTTQVKRHLEEIQKNGLNGRMIPLKFIVKSTPSSMHSFFEISRYLTDGPFCLTTVDTIFRESEFASYIKDFTYCVNNGNADGMMGVTDFIDDEKPLYVDVDNDMDITGFFDENNGYKYISGGIYGLTNKSIDILKCCIERGDSRMRNFQRALVNAGYHLKARPFSKLLDIDHVSDIRKAEQFLKQE